MLDDSCHPPATKDAMLRTRNDLLRWEASIRAWIPQAGFWVFGVLGFCERENPK